MNASLRVSGAFAGDDRGTMHARIVAEFGFHYFHVLATIGERDRADRVFNAGNKGAADCFGESAAKDDHRKAEDGDHIGDANGQQIGGVIHDFDRQRIVVDVGLGEHLAADLFDLAAFDQLRQDRLSVGGDETGEALDDVGAGAVVFEATRARGVAGKEPGVTDFARGFEAAVIELSVQDQAAADPGSNPDAQDILGTFGSSKALLTKDGDIDIVVEEDRDFELGGHDVGEFVVGPIEIDSLEDRAGGGVDCTRSADSDGFKLPGVDAGIVTGFLYTSHQTVNNRGGPFIGARLLT